MPTATYQAGARSSRPRRIGAPQCSCCRTNRRACLCAGTRVTVSGVETEMAAPCSPALDSQRTPAAPASAAWSPASRIARLARGRVGGRDSGERSAAYAGSAPQAGEQQQYPDGRERRAGRAAHGLDSRSSQLQAHEDAGPSAPRRVKRSRDRGHVTVAPFHCCPRSQAIYSQIVRIPHPTLSNGREAPMKGT